MFTSDELLIIIAFALLLCIYFLPAIVADWRNHRQQNAILVLTIFAGWTLIGWVGALVWACTTDVKPIAPRW